MSTRLLYRTTEQRMGKHREHDLAFVVLKLQIVDRTRWWWMDHRALHFHSAIFWGFKLLNPDSLDCFFGKQIKNKRRLISLEEIIVRETLRQWFSTQCIFQLDPNIFQLNSNIFQDSSGGCVTSSPSRTVPLTKWSSSPPWGMRTPAPWPASSDHDDDGQDDGETADWSALGLVTDCLPLSWSWHLLLLIQTHLANPEVPSLLISKFPSTDTVRSPHFVTFLLVMPINKSS